VPIRGVQTPKVSHVPAWHENYWQDVRDLCAGYDLNLDPWQETVLESALGEQADGQWAASRVGLSVARQSGKTALLEARELAGLILYGEELIIHSAHLVQTALEGFQRIKGFFENYDDLRKRVRQIRSANGEQGIELLTGQRLRFMARSRASARGFSADALLLDESQELSDQTWAAILPTVSARPNPQIWMVGTPPAPGMNGEVFARHRQAGLAGEDPRLCWMEWRSDEDANLDDRWAWAEANPSLGSRVAVEKVADERASMDDETFARERLGLWDSQTTMSVVHPDRWIALADPQSQADTRSVVFAADVAPDRQRGSIAVAGERPDGRVHVEVVENARGIAWMAPWLVERCKKYRAAVVLDPGSPAGALVPDLQKAGVEPLLMTTRDVGQACGMFFDGAVEDRLRHLDDPRLSTALAAGRKRDIGVNGLWAWHRRDTSTDLTPLVAATNAVWGFLARRPEPGRKRATGRSRSY
jgi:phage terminase large subunit-like protein